MRGFLKDPQNLKYSLRVLIPFLGFLTSFLSALSGINLHLLPGPSFLWLLILSSFSALCFFFTVFALTSPIKELISKAERMKILKGSKKEKSELKEIYELLERLLEILEREGMRKEEMERLDFLIPLGYMAMTVAHEVKNPLATITGMSELLKERLKDEKDRIYIDTILEAAKKIDIFSTSLLELSDNEIVKERFSIRDLIYECVESLKREFGEVRCELALKEEITVEADRTKIYQAIYNILRNAFEYEKNKGYVRIESYLKDSTFFLSIYNESSSLEEEDLKYLFRPFFSKRRGGRGLGLYIARKNIRLHGGEIEPVIEKKGVSFLLSLPFGG